MDIDFFIDFDSSFYLATRNNLHLNWRTHIFFLETSIFFIGCKCDFVRDVLLILCQVSEIILFCEVVIVNSVLVLIDFSVKVCKFFNTVLLAFISVSVNFLYCYTFWRVFFSRSKDFEILITWDMKVIKDLLITL